VVVVVDFYLRMNRNCPILVMKNTIYPNRRGVKSRRKKKIFIWKRELLVEVVQDAVLDDLVVFVVHAVMVLAVVVDRQQQEQFVGVVFAVLLVMDENESLIIFNQPQHLHLLVSSSPNDGPKIKHP
jgi:hypothetical protein